MRSEEKEQAAQWQGSPEPATALGTLGWAFATSFNLSGSQF